MGSDDLTDWSALFGETPKADAYSKRLEEMRGHARAAEVAAQLAERRAASAENALHENANTYAAKLAEYERIGGKIALTSRVIAVLTALVMVCTAANVVLHLIQ